MRLTARGVGVLALVGVAVALALMLHLPELIALAAGLAVLLVVALLSVGPTTQVEVTPPEALRVPRGVPATLDIALLDHGTRRMSGMRLRRLGGEGPEVVGLPQLRPHVPSIARVPLPTQARGPVVLGPWVVERVDAWSLARRRVTRVDQVEAVVVPRVHAIRMSGLPAAGADERPTRTAGDTDVATLREYVVGDEPRFIHWRSSARAGTLMVRQHLDARRPGVHVVLDVSRESYASDADFEEAVDAAASLAVSAALTGVTVDVTTSAGETARAGQGRHAGVLDLLARVQRVDAAGYSRSFESGGVLLVTGSGGAGTWGARTVVRIGSAFRPARGDAVVTAPTAAALADLAAR